MRCEYLKYFIDLEHSTIEEQNQNKQLIEDSSVKLEFDKPENVV